MELSEYQRRAQATNHLERDGTGALLQPILGLATEVASIQNISLRYLRDIVEKEDWISLIKDELGDLLWYIAAIATASGFELDDIAQSNLNRSQDRYLAFGNDANYSDIAPYDADDLPQERFPRQMVLRFTETEDDAGRIVATVHLQEANPNAFPDGRVLQPDGKWTGFDLNKPLGDPLTDNSTNADGYRYHDAIHISFMAILGWSPNMRALLRTKRKSNPHKDEYEDGARAIFTEEGLAAVIAKLAETRAGLLRDTDVSGDIVEVAKAVTSDLEVASAPAWLWRRAISKGIETMNQLTKNGGGYLHIDLDTRNVKYSHLR